MNFSKISTDHIAPTLGNEIEEEVLDEENSLPKFWPDPTTQWGYKNLYMRKKQNAKDLKCNTGRRNGPTESCS